MTIDTSTKAYSAGIKAAWAYWNAEYAGSDEPPNPYEKGTKEHAEYDLGWSHASDDWHYSQYVDSE